MILGTNSNCKVMDISISETTATITLLVFATEATNPAKSFHIYIQDENSYEKTRLDNCTYWVDRINNYDHDANNIDTNKYKEIIIKVDITNGNTSKIVGNKWVRSCYIYLIDVSNASGKIAWSSDKLTLISDEFEVPEIYNISFATSYPETNVVTNEVKAYVILSFRLSYISEKDFNYNNKNILAQVNVKAATTDELLETINISTSTDLFNKITTKKKYAYGIPVKFEILLVNRVGDILSKTTKIYKPAKKYTNSYVKIGSEVKRVVAYYVATDSKTEHEGEWLYERD